MPPCTGSSKPAGPICTSTAPPPPPSAPPGGRPPPPPIRVDGELRPLPGTAALTPADTEAVLDTLLGDPARRQEFDRDCEIDFAHAISGLARFRINAFRQRGSVSLVCRAIPFGIKTIDELDLPQVLGEIAREE